MEVRTFKLPFTCALLTVLMTSPITALGYDKKARVTHIKGIAVTGPNDQCGEGVLKMPAPFPPDVSGRFVGVFDPDPNAVDALPLTPDDCANPDDRVLASTTDQEFQAFLGFPDADPQVKNIPLHLTPVIIRPDGVRASIPGPGAAPPNPFPPIRITNEPITLKQWLGARGHMRVRCGNDDSAQVSAAFRNLIPNGVYTMWAVWSTTPPGAPGPGLVPLPFGGIPNVAVADQNGRLTFERKLSVCPFDPTPDGSQLLFADLLYHSEGSIFGAVPEKPAQMVDFLLPDGTTIISSFLSGGITTHDQVIFPITAPRLREQ